SDSAHRIGPSMLSKGVLTVEEGVSGWRLKNPQIGHVVHYSSTLRPRKSKRTTVLKSARQIGVSTISKDVLTVDEGVCGWRFKNAKFGAFLITVREPAPVRPNGERHRIQRIK